MIKSVNKCVYDVISGATSYIYAYSTLENVRNNEQYIIRTTYMAKKEVGESTQDIALFTFEEYYTADEINYIFEQLKPVIGSLPFTQMVAKGIEISLYNFLDTHEKFGIPVNSNGWEII